MSAEDREQIARSLNDDMESLSIVHNEKKILEAELEEAIRLARQPFQARIEELTSSIDEITKRMAQVVVDNRETLFNDETKLLSLRSGKLVIKLSPGKLVIDDEDAALRYIRNNGKLRMFTKLGKRTLDKMALKRAPEFVAKARGMHIEQSEILSIKPAKAQGEIVTNLNPFKRKV